MGGWSCEWVMMRLCLARVTGVFLCIFSKSRQCIANDATVTYQSMCKIRSLCPKWRMRASTEQPAKFAKRLITHPTSRNRKVFKFTLCVHAGCVLCVRVCVRRYVPVCGARVCVSVCLVYKRSMSVESGGKNNEEVECRDWYSKIMLMFFSSKYFHPL